MGMEDYSMEETKGHQSSCIILGGGDPSQYFAQTKQN
jgi:hypothetical protein